MTFDPLTHLLALAPRLEGEGQYNNAKLLRAAAAALLTRGAHRLDLPTDKAALLAETDRAIESLSVLNVGADLMTALEHLHSTPEKVAALLDGVADSRANLPPADGGWSLRQAVSHLREAQGVLDFRVALTLDHDNPILESKAVFEWATNEADQPPTVREIYETYRASRAQTVARLESLPLKDWWRRGQHEEFGELRLHQQVSYFACHELAHFPQLMGFDQE